MMPAGAPQPWEITKEVLNHLSSMEERFNLLATVFDNLGTAVENVWDTRAWDNVTPPTGMDWFPICASCYVIHTPNAEINDDDYPEDGPTQEFCCFCGCSVTDGNSVYLHQNSVIFSYERKSL